MRSTTGLESDTYMIDSNQFSQNRQIVTGVLMTNLGTPDAPTTAALRRYLAEFLWDPRIVDIPRPLWWLILHGFILRFRPSRSAASYRSVWTDDGSPLLSISKKQQEALQQLLSQQLGQSDTGSIVVELGMRYGNPSIESALEKLREANAQRILVFPLYPQNSCSTTASTFDAVAEAVKKWRWIPEFRFINQYHDVPDYIEALAASVREAWNEREQPEKLLFSFHGTPKRFFTEGDPYFTQCHQTAILVAERLGMPEDRWQLTFQSIFGREEWLGPYTIDRLKELAANGVTSVDIVCPGFSADCLETIEEICVENRDAYIEAGGKTFNYIPALNDRVDHIQALSNLVQKNTIDWF